ncbi:MAG TPA: hypothetical protein VF121_04485 [Thermoanaerobaculia bacterium]|nr:hypothetical protein [Thermoanaerobaculia bacterium]
MSSSRDCAAAERAAAAVVAAALLLAPPGRTAGAQGAELDPLAAMPRFDQYDPPSTLVVPGRPVARARYPFVDVHSHQPDMPEQDLRPLLAAMDEMGMAVMVNLSGRGFREIERGDGSRDFDVQAGEYLRRAMANVARTAPARFAVFTNVSFEGVGAEGWAAGAVRQLEEDVAAGAQGLSPGEFAPPAGRFPGPLRPILGTHGLPAVLLPSPDGHDGEARETRYSGLQPTYQRPV